MEISSDKMKRSHPRKNDNGDNYHSTEPAEASIEGGLDSSVEESKRKRKNSEKAVNSESEQSCKKPKVHHSKRSKKKKRKKRSRETVDDDDTHQIGKRHKKRKTEHKGMKVC